MVRESISRGWEIEIVDSRYVVRVIENLVVGLNWIGLDGWKLVSW